MEKKDKLQGIGGWLLLFTIIIALTGLLYLREFFLFIDSNLNLSLRLSLICVVMVSVVIYTLILELKHKKEFPKWAIRIFWMRFLAALYIELAIMVDVGSITPSEVWFSVLFSAIFTIVSILYFKKSQRVKNTFIK